jgi:2-hydroxychromene-2-carboxylate isomerase
MTGIAKQAPEIEFPFEFGSDYGYLSVMRIDEEAGVAVVWKPFLVGPIFRKLGMENRPSACKGRAAYVRQDVARLCRKYDLAPTRRAGH